jgi:ascorbate-specific PTS system EIIC-type component UlaA
MLLFLQENILIAAIMMTAIFVMIVLVLLFSSYTRRKQAL